MALEMLLMKWSTAVTSWCPSGCRVRPPIGRSVARTLGAQARRRNARMTAGSGGSSVSDVDGAAGSPVFAALAGQESLVHQEPPERRVVRVETPQHRAHLALGVSHADLELQGQAGQHGQAFRAFG